MPSAGLLVQSLDSLLVFGPRADCGWAGKTPAPLGLTRDPYDSSKRPRSSEIKPDTVHSGLSSLHEIGCVTISLPHRYSQYLRGFLR